MMWKNRFCHLGLRGRKTGLPHVLRMSVIALLSVFIVPSASAQTNDNHLLLSVGALYEKGFDATIAYEHSTKYHHAWEYFAMGYVQYKDNPDAGHVTKQSFWHNYQSWHLGIVYKPCVSRGRNHHANLRLGASGGSDLHDFVGGIHVGYEHAYALRGGWELFFQVKEDVVIKSDKPFRTGLACGVKLPL